MHAGRFILLNQIAKLRTFFLEYDNKFEYLMLLYCLIYLVAVLIFNYYIYYSFDFLIKTISFVSLPNYSTEIISRSIYQT